MTKITSLQAIAAALLACGLSAAPAQAGPNRTFVSGTGTDSGACSRTAPCRTFAFAITVTNAGGEIDVLDPAGYGAVTINHAISIVNDGVGTAGITAGSGNGVTINAGASDNVHLRGLTIDGLGTGNTGVQFNTGASLTLTNCNVRHFTNTGILILPTGAMNFLIGNTLVSDNSQSGISVVSAGTGGAMGAIVHVAANNNKIGIDIETSAGTTNVTIIDSVTSDNSARGVFSFDAGTTVMVRNSAASNNGTGFDEEGGSTMLLAHTVATGNATGVTVSGGKVFSYGDNDINNNSFDVDGILTPIATK